MGAKYNDKYLYKRKVKGNLRQNEEEEATSWGLRLEQCGYQSKNTWSHQKRKEGSLEHTTEENYVKNSVVERGQTSESWGKVRHHAGFL